MKRLLNFLFVNRSETLNKWWHRLFKVLLFGSAIIVFMTSIFLIVDDYSYDWGLEYQPVFSLEPNYNEIDAKEFDCTRSPFIECQGPDISSYDLKRYQILWQEARDNLWKQSGLAEKYETNKCEEFPLNLKSGSLTTKMIAEMRVASGLEGYPTTSGNISTQERAGIICWMNVVTEEYKDPAYAIYTSSLGNLPLKVKFLRDIHYVNIVYDILYLIVASIISVLVWIIFWSAIVYRSTLYIIFGKVK